MTKLQVLDDAYGLNLTFGTLGTFLKYPNADGIDKSKIARGKRGIFQSEREYFDKTVDACGLLVNGEIIRHPLAYLMEAADSICYLVMDIEDGFNKGWYKYEDIRSFLVDIPGLEDVFSNLDIKHASYGKEVAKVVNLRIRLIKTLIDLAITNFVSNLDKIFNGTYHEELIFDDKNGLARRLQSFCKENIFPEREIQSLELTGHSVLTGLLNYYLDFTFHRGKDYNKRAKGMISESIIRTAILENNLASKIDYDKLSDYYKLRTIVDYISGMTDQYALDQYQILSGQKIN